MYVKQLNFKILLMSLSFDGSLEKMEHTSNCKYLQALDTKRTERAAVLFSVFITMQTNETNDSKPLS